MAITSSFKRHWERRRAKVQEAQANGSVIITEKGRRLNVVCPYSDEFTRGAIELGGTWRDKSGMWSFRAVSRRLVLDLVNKCWPEIIPALVRVETKRGEA